MPQKIAIAIVHGVGKQGPTFAEGMIRKLREQFAKEAKLAPAAAAEALVFEPVYWGPVLHGVEEELWKRVRQGGDLDFVSLRRFVVDFAADAIAYQPTPADRHIYDAVHEVVATALRKLALAAGEKAPLCVIAHSLGTVIASNYLYDLATDPRRKKRKLIGASVRELIGETPLEWSETLAFFYTLGSPIAIWSLRYKDFGVPVQVPAPQLAQHWPRLKGRWVNFYDSDDILGYPLRPLNAAYRKVVAADLAINVGSFLMSWNPGAHMGYWEDKDVIGPIAHDLATAWRAVNG